MSQPQRLSSARLVRHLVRCHSILAYSRPTIHIAAQYLDLRSRLGRSLPMRYLGRVQPHFRRLSTPSAVSGPTQGLAGTTPFHNYYVMLHSRNPPREFPKVVSSSVQKALQLALIPSKGLVNFSWSPQQSLPPPLSSDGEVYSATAFSKAGDVIELENVSLSNAHEAVQRITGLGSTARHNDVVYPLYIYVCTHAARDCRCGDAGSSVAEAFRKEIVRRELTSVVKLGETGHVGGHKWGISQLGSS